MLHNIFTMKFAIIACTMFFALANLGCFAQELKKMKFCFRNG